MLWSLSLVWSASEKGQEGWSDMPVDLWFPLAVYFVEPAPDAGKLRFTKPPISTSGRLGTHDEITSASDSSIP